LSVQEGYTDNDFSHDLSFVLNSAVTGGFVYQKLSRLRGLRSATSFKVASFNRVQAASAAKTPAHEQFVELRLLVTKLSQRISLLETSINQPPSFDLAKQVAMLGADSLLPPVKRKK
jgi:hypothetical protein